jgi:hypothetical protein
MIFKKDKKKKMRYKDLTDMEKKHLFRGLVLDFIIGALLLGAASFIFYITVVA